jgi:23S rRNA pseudouridine2605 synthase
MDDNSKTDTSKPDTQGERIAKAIARAGLASRREAEQWIAAGRVAVNGAVVTSPALNITASDRVEVDGARLPTRERTRLFLYHKPRGLVTTHADPKGRPTIFERLPEDLPRLISVGRLDLNTEGLILLTNDGGLARELELPTTGWLRRYRVRAHGTVMQPQLDEIRAGVTVDGIHYGEIDATLDRVQGANLWLTFAIREGKNREVRNVLGHLGLSVNRLIRVSFGPFQLGDLGEGEIEEVRTRVLREQLGERVIAASGADFSTPPVPPPAQRPEPPPERREAPPQRREPPAQRRERPGRDSRDRAKPPREERGKAKSLRGPKSPAPAHSWRGGAETGPGKKLQRQFRGSRRDETRAERSEDKPRAGLLTDRKGRRVLVERFKAKAPPPPERPEPETRQRSPRGRGRRSPDRASGARPHRPRKS